MPSVETNDRNGLLPDQHPDYRDILQAFPTSAPQSLITSGGRRYALELSIVMPCLNEADTVGICILKAQSAIHELNIDAEIIIADNGSNDGSQEIAEAWGRRLSMFWLGGTAMH